MIKYKSRKILGWLKIKLSGIGANISAINIVAFISVIQHSKNVKKTPFGYFFLARL